MTESKAISAALTEFYRKPTAVVTIELILTIGLVIILAIAIIKPTLSTMSQLSKEIKEKKQLSQKLEKKAAALASAQSVYFASQSKLQLLNQAIPNQDTLITDLKTLEKMAGENAVVITNMGVKALPEVASRGAQIAPSGVNQVVSTPTGQNSRLPISLSVEGDYLSIRDFVNDVISHRRLFLIENISFSIRKQQANQALSATITIETPFYQQ